MARFIKSCFQKFYWLCICGLILALNLLPSQIQAETHAKSKTQEPLIVFAAASLKNPLDEIANDWHKAGNSPLLLSYAGSGKLARQIIKGAPANLFISAHQAWMEELQKSNLLVGGGFENILTNELVLIAHDKSLPQIDLSQKSAFKTLLMDDYIAMGFVNSVPAGIYAKAALEKLALWEIAKPQLVQGDNVRAVLRLVANGDAGFGIVYKSDTTDENLVKLIADFPKDSYPKIEYPIALIEEFPHPDAKAFYQHLFSKKAMAIFKRYGFGVGK